MNERDRLELEEILAVQRSLRERLDRLELRVETLRGKMERAAEPRMVVPEPPVSPVPMAPVMPPPLPVERLSPMFRAGSAEERTATPVPPAVKPEPQNWGEPEVEEPVGGSIEMQIGRVWLVRIGIVMLLTGFVFLGNYAYQNFIGRLGPWGKIALLTLGGGLLTGIGLQLEKRRAELINFARVMLGGGLAALYYTAYAAHFVPNLQIIRSPVMGGALLLGVAGVVVWMAEKRRSQTLALIAILLSYYTSAINPLAGFTLLSNLLLSGTAVWFLVRNGWAALSYASLVGSYASYGFWRFYRGIETGWQWDRMTQGLWLGLGFLFSYWLLFTVAGFLARGDSLRSGRRMGFLSLNNAAFFLFGSVAFGRVMPYRFWLFAISFGAVLLGLAWLARRLHPDDRHMDAAYLAEGLVVFTAGIVAKLGGYQLPLVLAVESAVVLACCRQRHGWLYRVFSGLCATLAFGIAMERVGRDPSLAPTLGTILPLIFLFNARWFKRLTGREEQFSLPAAANVALALVLAARSFDPRMPVETAVLAFAVAGVALTWLRVLHGLIELSILAQGYVVWAALGWLNSGNVIPAYIGLVLVGATLSLAHWWQRGGGLDARARMGGQLFGAFATAVLLAFWCQWDVRGDLQLIVIGIAFLALLFHASFARMWPMLAGAQVLLLVMTGRYFWDLANGHSLRWQLLASLALVIAAAEVVRRLRYPVDEVVPQFASSIYRWVAFAMYVAWGVRYVPGEHMFWFFIGSALVLFAMAVVSRVKERVIFSAIMAAVGFLLFWFGPAKEPTFANLLAVLSVLGVQQIVRRKFSGVAIPVFVQPALIGLGCFTLWLHLTRWADQSHVAIYLTVTWAVLAGVLFGMGIFARERVYRWCGLLLTALTLGRVLFVDLWRLGQLAQWVSLMVLGAVLLGVSFLYNRFADRLKEWL